MTRKEFNAKLIAATFPLMTNPAIAVGAQALIALPNCDPQWCRVLSIAGEVPTSENHDERYGQAMHHRAEVVVRGGRRYYWPTIDLLALN